MKQVKDLGRKYFVKPLSHLFINLRISPNAITISSLFFAIAAGYCFYCGRFFLAAIFYFFSGIFDSFDGEVARRTNRITNTGAFLDSTIDRVNEFLVYLGILLYFNNQHESNMVIWTTVTIFGSFMVSYTRARAEGVGVSPQVGLFERFLRTAFIIIGSFFGPKVMSYVIIILCIGTLATALQRVIFVLRHNHNIKKD